MSIKNKERQKQSGNHRFIPFSPFIPGFPTSPFIPCFPDLPGGPITPFVPVFPLDPLGPRLPRFPGVPFRPRGPATQTLPGERQWVLMDSVTMEVRYFLTAASDSPRLTIRS